MSDKMREEFEVAYQAACLSRAVARFDPSVFAKDHCDDYLNSLVQSAWWGWQCSRAALLKKQDQEQEEFLAHLADFEPEDTFHD